MFINYSLESGKDISLEEIFANSHKRHWIPLSYCIKCWQAFSKHVTIASNEMFEAYEDACSDDQFTRLPLQVKLLGKFFQISRDKFDHTSSFGNLLATYYYFEHLRHLLRIACSIDCENKEYHKLFNFVEELWISFLNIKVSIKIKERLKEQVKVWFHQGKFFTHAAPTNSISINNILVTQIFNADPKKEGSISSAVRGNDLIIYTSVKNFSKSSYKMIMKEIKKRILSKSTNYTLDTIIQRIL